MHVAFHLYLDHTEWSRREHDDAPDVLVTMYVILTINNSAKFSGHCELLFTNK
jgi:hypothetical protein